MVNFLTTPGSISSFPLWAGGGGIGGAGSLPISSPIGNELADSSSVAVGNGGGGMTAPLVRRTSAVVRSPHADLLIGARVVASNGYES